MIQSVTPFIHPACYLQIKEIENKIEVHTYQLPNHKRFPFCEKAKENSGDHLICSPRTSAENEFASMYRRMEICHSSRKCEIVCHPDEKCSKQGKGKSCTVVSFSLISVPRPSLSIPLRRSPFVSPQVKKYPYFGDEMKWEITLLDQLACAPQSLKLVRREEVRMVQQPRSMGWEECCDAQP